MVGIFKLRRVVWAPPPLLGADMMAVATRASKARTKEAKCGNEDWS